MKMDMIPLGRHHTDEKVSIFKNGTVLNGMERCLKKPPTPDRCFNPTALCSSTNAITLKTGTTSSSLSAQGGGGQHGLLVHHLGAIYRITR